MRGSAYSVSRDQQTPPLSGITYTPPLTCWWHPMVQHSSITKPELVENHDFCPSYEFHPVGILPRLVWKSSNDVAIPMVKKCWRCVYIYSFRQNTRTWQTDIRRTPHDSMPRLCIASRGKNWKVGHVLTQAYFRFRTPHVSFVCVVLCCVFYTSSL